MDLDIADIHAYLYRYPVVMFEETGGEPYDGNYNRIYNNAKTVGLRNARNVKKGLDVPLRNDLHKANNAFERQGLTPQDRGTGPTNFFDLAKFWYTFQKSYASQNEQTPPMFVRLEVPGDRYFDTLQFLWNDRNTGGEENWSAFAVRVVKAGYCSVGDVIAKNSELVEKIVEQNDTNDDTTYGFSKAKHLLFAHKSICIDCPPKEIARWDEYGKERTRADPLGWTTGWKPRKWRSFGPRRLYIADVTGYFPNKSGVKQASYSDLYQPMGIYATRNIMNAAANKVRHNVDNYNENKTEEEIRQTRYSEEPLKKIDVMVTPVAVLKTALFYYDSNITWTIIDDSDSDSSGHLYSNPTIYDVDNVLLVDSPRDKFLLHFNPQTVFSNILEEYMSASTDLYNRTKQTLTNDPEKKHDFFRGLCSMSPKIDKYPKICACLGNGNEEAEYKRLVPNFSMFCHSGTCINGNTLNGVYKFEQATNCPKVQICDINLKGTALENFDDYAKTDAIEKSCTTKNEPLPNLPPASASLHNTRLRWLHLALFAVMAIFVAIVVAFSLKLKK